MAAKKKIRPVLRKLEAARDRATKPAQKREITKAIREIRRTVGEPRTQQEMDADRGQAISELREARNATVTDAGPSKEYDQIEVCEAIKEIREQWDEMSVQEKTDSQSYLKQLLGKEYAKPVHGRIEKVLTELYGEDDAEETRFDAAVADLSTATGRSLLDAVDTIKGAAGKFLESGDETP